MASKTGKKRMSYDEAAAALPDALAQLEAAAGEYSQRSVEILAPYRAALAALREAERKLAIAAQPVAAAKERVNRLKLIVDRGPKAVPLEVVEVDNPLRADELVAAELEAGDERLSSRIKVDVRMSALVGGLCRVEGVTDFQRAAAGRFRTLWELSQIGGARAIDYTSVRVDTSGGPADRVLTSGEDARREYAQAVQLMGMVKSNLVERVVCDEMGIRELARHLGRADGGKARQALLREVLEGVDVLVKYFHMGPAQGRARLVAEGERLPLPTQRTEVIYDRGAEGTKAA